MRIFINYCREDLEIATRLVEDLKSRGIEFWFDQENFRPGAIWRDEAEEAIRKSSYFVALLSAKSLSKKGFVHKELRLAFDMAEEMPHRTQFVIPVRVDECEPSYPALKESQWVDLFSSYEKGLDQLLRLFSAPLSEEGFAGGRADGSGSRPAGRGALNRKRKVPAKETEGGGYVGPRIEGLWSTEITFPRGEKNWHRMRINRNNHSISGKITCYEGYSKGFTYDLEGTFESPILTFIYRISDGRRFERGSMVLMLVGDGLTLKGQIAYYESETNSIEATTCEWRRKR